MTGRFRSRTPASSTAPPSLLAAPPATEPNPLARTRIVVEERLEHGRATRVTYDLLGTDSLPPTADALVSLLEGLGLTVTFVPRPRLVPGDSCAAAYCGCRMWRPVVRGNGGRAKCSCGHSATTSRAQKPGHLLVEGL